MLKYLWRRLTRNRLRPLGEPEPQQLRVHSSSTPTAAQNPLATPTASCIELTKNATTTTEARAAGSAAGGVVSSLGISQKCKSGVIKSDAEPSPKTPTVAIPSPAAVSEAPGNISCAKNRFWRSSQNARANTKLKRRSKCNSFDSGIEIELDRDEHCVYPAVSGQREAVDSLTNMPGNNQAVACTISCTRSPKPSSISEELATARPSLLKQLTVCSESNTEPLLPKSFTPRSFSQPNGLEKLCISRDEINNCECDKVASHNQANSNFKIYAEVLHNFVAAGPQELDLEQGNVVEVLRKESGPWWLGRHEKQHTRLVEKQFDPVIGWFPKDFVHIIDSAKAMLCVKPPPPPSQNPLLSSRRHNNPAFLVDRASSRSVIEPLAPVVPNDCDAMRQCAVRELLEAEINYVKLLGIMCDRYLPALSQRIDIFSPSSIRLIFSNITDIYKFQQKFLQVLRSGIEQNQLSKVFIQMHKGFLCYSAYCNAYPRALAELEACQRQKNARDILQNCSKIGNLAVLPLSAHLLAPVQRICRYPLHLNQLIKTALNSNGSGGPNDIELHADVFAFEQMDVLQFDIPDTYDTINVALTQMRSIAEAVNEAKRHSEIIARYQESFQSFKGPPVHTYSTRFFHQVDATRQKQNLWNSSCTLFLFENQLIYGKRDVIKRNQFFYKGRILLDRCRVMNMEDGKAFGYTIKNLLRIYCTTRGKWYDFSFRSAIRKHVFLNALAQERQFGGRALYVAPMTGCEFSFEARPGDYSNQSDNDALDCAYAQVTTSASGDSSLPKTLLKSPMVCSNPLAKAPESRDTTATTSSGNGQMLPITSTGSLCRRRLSNWFRKPKTCELDCGLNAHSTSTATAITTHGTFSSAHRQDCSFA